MTEGPLLADVDGVQMSAFSAAETTCLKDRGFAVNDHGDEATVTGAMTVRIAKTEVAGDNAVLHITLPNGERLVMRAFKFSAVTTPLKQA
jgi:hypothetical protein